MSPRAAAVAAVRGGFLRRRPGTPAGAVYLAEYGRVALEPARLGVWNVPGRTRVALPPARLVRLGRPPRVAPTREAPRPVEGLRAEWAPYVAEFFPRRWRRPAAATALGVPRVEVSHRERTAFAGWARRRVHRGYRTGPYGFRPHTQGDPVRVRREWSHLTGVSPLSGLRAVPRWVGLRRRRRHHRRSRRRLRRWCRFQRYHFGRRRRRLRLGLRRYLLFRRRRLRGYRTRRVTSKNYFRGVTRAGFKKFEPARAARAARAAALVGGPYVGALVDWATHPLSRRVATPLEYNLDRPAAGYFKLEKRRRPGARRWKLGQHPAGVPYREARQMRWAWFGRTAWGAFLEVARGAPLGDPPAGPGPAGGAYWSVEKWGRSRWPTRPVARGTRVFVRTHRTGFAVERDAQQWGRAGTGPAGVLFSVVAETELVSPAVDADGLPHPANRRRRRGGYFVWAVRRVGYFARVVAARAWILTGLLWWPYAALATGWLAAAYLPVWAFYRAVALGRAVWAGVAALATQLWRPVRRVGWRLFRTGRFARTVGWVYAAWTAVYSAEDDRSELDLLMPHDDEYNLIEDEDVNYTLEHDQEFDQLGEGVHRGLPFDPDKPGEEGWIHDLSGWYLEGLDQMTEFFFQEMPYRAGLVFRPAVDFLVRLPVWGLLEGASLAVLTCKLEYHRVWYALLTRPGGRWWKVLLVGAAWAARAAAAAAVFVGLVSQLEYATLRVELVVTWGVTWREEYYLGWVFFCFLSAVYLVGPAGWKHFFFREVGWNHLAGLFVGTVETVDPEEYYPARPATPVARAIHLGGVATTYARDDTYLHPAEFDRDTPSGRINLGAYSDVRLVLLREYGFDEVPYDPVSDLEDLGFLFPGHLGTRSPDEILYPLAWVDPRVRSTRDGAGARVDRYYYDFGITNHLPAWLPGNPPGELRQDRLARTAPEDTASE